MTQGLTVYLETSVISYLTNRPSTNAITLGRQLLTQQWWEERSAHYDLVISDFVIQEIRAGHPEAVARRVAAVQHLRILDSANPDIERLAIGLINSKAIPAHAELDALHIATCAVNQVQFLASWNFTHIVNAQQMQKIHIASLKLGFQCPQLITLDSLTA